MRCNKNCSHSSGSSYANQTSSRLKVTGRYHWVCRHQGAALSHQQRILWVPDTGFLHYLNCTDMLSCFYRKWNQLWTWIHSYLDGAYCTAWGHWTNQQDVSLCWYHDYLRNLDSGATLYVCGPRKYNHPFGISYAFDTYLISACWICGRWTWGNQSKLYNQLLSPPLLFLHTSSRN